MDILNKYPEVKKQLEKLLQTQQARRNEILNYMLETDTEYKKIVQERSQTSAALKNMLVGIEANTLFEEYSDAICSFTLSKVQILFKK